MLTVVHIPLSHHVPLSHYAFRFYVMLVCVNSLQTVDENIMIYNGTSSYTGCLKMHYQNRTCSSFRLY